MPQPLSPRSIRGDAMFDLDQMFEELQQGAKVLAHINRLRHQAKEALHAAQAAEEWDGQTERRRSGHIVSVMNAAAQAELAATWDPRSVAA